MRPFGFLKTALMYALVAMTLVVWMPSAKGQTQDGTAEHPYLIQNEEQLRHFAQCINSTSTFYWNSDNGDFSTTRPTNYRTITNVTGVHYKLNANINLNGGDVAGCDGNSDGLTAWEPIRGFAGDFDGNYKLISGLFVNNPNTDDQGLFATITNGSVKNLGLVNAYISGKDHVGGIVGRSLTGNISHCFVDATIVAKGRYVGGIAGEMYGNNGHIALDTCYVSGSITSPSDNVGGVCGVAENASITSCYSSAIVNYTATSQVGGVLGVNRQPVTTSVENCFYDRQMCSATTTYGTGKLTNDMVKSYWTELGENYLFEYAGSSDDYYPSLKGFDQTNYQVRLSTLPVILNGEQAMSDVRENFSVGGKGDGFSWVSSDNSVAEVTIESTGYVVVVKKQGWFQLTGRYGSNPQAHTVAMYTTFGAIKGSEANPFTIDTQKDLLAFRDGINSGTPFTYKHYTVPARGANTAFLQTANITLPSGDGSWNGNNKISKDAATAFAGIYDGGNFELQGLNVTSGSYGGLFGYIQYGTVRNLGVRVAKFAVSQYSGVICGVIYGGTIENCYSVPASASVVLSFYIDCGGIVGYANYDTVRIINCRNECNININTSVSSTGARIGGIIGSTAQNAVSCPHIDLIDCVNKGNISGYITDGGGIAGYLYGIASHTARIIRCHNHGDFFSSAKASSGSWWFLGGIFGHKNSRVVTVSYCSNRGNLTGYSNFGGITGYSTNGVDHCYNTGDITLQDVGQVRVVGAYGIAPGTVHTSFNMGKITVERGYSAYGITSGEAYDCFNAGEISVGSVWTAVPISANGNCQRNYNIGKVTGTLTYGVGEGGNKFYDSQMVVDPYYTTGTAKKTNEMLGTSLQSALGANWEYTAGMYPRIKGLEHEDASIVAASPVRLATGQDVSKVSSSFNVNGCDSSVVWTSEGALVTAISSTCTSNSAEVSVSDVAVAGATTLTATRNGVSKTVHLSGTATVSGTLNVTSVVDLRTLRNGVNSGAPFDYNGTIVPAGAAGTTFKQTATDIDLSSDENWEPIGTESSPFRGKYDGQGHKISNLKQSGMTIGGLFGYTKLSKVQDLTLSDVNISNIYSSTGAFVANAFKDTLERCYATGSVKGSTVANNYSQNSVGGFVGNATANVLSYCENSCKVTGDFKSYAGGLVGRSLATNGTIDNCANLDTVKGGNYVGGLVGQGMSVTNSYNAGNVIGTDKAAYVGGIGGYNAKVNSCFNMGKVEALQCAAGTDTYVGGIVGRIENGSSRYYEVNYSYNAGIVDGSNRKYVGGLVGAITGSYTANITESYVLNAVNSTGEYKGSIIGYSNGNSYVSKNYYDYTFSQLGGINDADVANRAVKKTTTEMENTGLSSLFTTSGKWAYAAGYYPRVESLKTKDASYASAAQLQLPTGQLASSLALDVNLTMGGCTDDVSWGLDGNCISFNNSACTGHVDNRGVVYVTSTKNGIVKYVKINAGVSSNSPLVIKSREELMKFRDFINAGATFYYRGSDSTYQQSDGAGYFAVTNQGADLYFKLICDVNLADTVWTPIGLDETHSFAGHFNGGNHTVSGMKITSNGSNKGFIGYLQNGSIDSLQIRNSKMSGTGDYRGLVCGYSNTGIIDHCSSASDTLFTSSGNYVGLVCGYSAGTVRDCSSTNDTISSSSPCVGGILGYGKNGSIDYCNVNSLKCYATGSYSGGVVGYANHNLINTCSIEDSKLRFTTNGYFGGLCGRAIYGDIRYCHSRNTELDATGSSGRVGGIVGDVYSYNGTENPADLKLYIQNCTNEGGFVKSTASYLGGICGYADVNSYTNINGCANHTTVEGTGTSATYVGGIVGADGGNMDSCRNTGKVTGYSRVGGIAGSSVSWTTQIYRCYNTGDVKGSGNYVGGIVGYNDALYVYGSFNTGKVVGNDYVGGIIGRDGRYIKYCYNVGQVYGSSYVGGLEGAKLMTDYTSGGVTENNYSAAHVQGNSITGALFGYVDVQPMEKVGVNYYDKQFSFSTGIGGSDVAGKAEGKLTREMVNNGIFSDATYWVVSDSLYPQLKFFYNKTVWGRTVSQASVTPVWMPNDDLTSWTLPSEAPLPNVYGVSRNSVKWSVVEGLTALDALDNVHFTIKSAGVVTVAASVDDVPYKHVRLIIGISEEHPMEITDYTELKNFRTNINRDTTFFYDATTKKFYQSQDAEFSYIEIPAGGEGMFFRLNDDIDMATYSDTWIPIGGTSNPFRGNFNGNNKTIKGMKVERSTEDYNGLFGYSTGSIRNLQIAKATVNGNTYTGALCGFNRGTIVHCSAVEGTVTGAANYTGGLCGYSQNSSVSESYNTNTVSGTGYVGGLVGRIESGVFQFCFNTGKVTASSDFCGGIAGRNSSSLSDSYNTGIIKGANYVGGVTGYNEKDQFTHVYNAGYVEGTGTSVGGLSNAGSGNYFPANSACDMRMNPASGVVNGIDPNNQSKQTEQMTGNALEGTLGGNWTYTDSLYPRLTALATEDASFVSATPIYLQGAQTVLDVASTFVAYNKNGVTWDYVVPTDVVDLTNANAPESGEVTVNNCGEVSLVVSKGTDVKSVKQVNLIVQNVSAEEKSDTTCGEPYYWESTGRYYASTNDYIEPELIGPGCNRITTLHLVVPEPLDLTMDSRDVVCNGQDDGYATPTVTGGFNSYNYEWTKEGDPTFNRTTAALTDLAPGKYYLLVTDATKPTCQLRDSVVIGEPAALVVSDSMADSHCYNDNDGTLSFSIAGGIAPYRITWTTPIGGSAIQSLAGTYSMSGLTDGTYNFTVKDANNCSKTQNIVVNDNDEVYYITAFDVEKTYDGISVNPYQYMLQIGMGNMDTLAAGTPHTLDNGDVLTVTVSQTSSLTDANEYANNIDLVQITRGGEDVTCRYHIEQTNSFIRINKRNVILTSGTASQPITGGTTLSYDHVEVGGDGWVSGQGATYSVTGVQNGVGTSYNTFTYTLNDGTAASNYTITQVEGLLSITSAGTLVVTFMNKSKVYDGEALVGEYSATGLHPGDHVVLQGWSAPSYINYNDGGATYTIDSVNVRVKDESDNDVTGAYNTIVINPGRLTVEQRPITLTSNTRTKVYDGTELYDHEVTISGDVNNVFSSKIENLRASALTPVTDYKAVPDTNVITFGVLSGYVADNYIITKNQGTLSITKKPATYRGASSTEPYTGAEQCLTEITTSGLLAGHTLSGVTYSVCGTEADTYTGTFSGDSVVMNGATDVTHNYALTSERGTLTIEDNDNAIVITSATLDGVYYDGANHTKQEYTVTYGGANVPAIDGTDGKQFKLPTNDTITITPTDFGLSGITDVPATPVVNDFTYSFPASDNYTTAPDVSGKGTLNLKKREVILRSKSWTQAYTGGIIRKDEISVSGRGFVSGEGIEEPNWTVMSDPVDAGEYDNVFTYTLKSNTTAGNYIITVDTGTITITKRTVTVTADNKSRTYGENNPTFTATYEGFANGETEDYVRNTQHKLTGYPEITTTATSTSPKGSDYVITLTTGTLSATNYDFYPVNGTLAITTRQIHINPLPVTATYNGLSHTYLESDEPHYVLPDPSELRSGDQITGVKINGSARVAGTPSGTVSVIGDTIMNGEEDVTSNYELIGGTANINIAKKTLKIKVQSGTREYDGMSHREDAIATPNYVVDAVDSLAVTDSIASIVFTGGGTLVGTHKVSIDTLTIKIQNREIDHTINVAGSYRFVVDTGYLTITKNTTPIVITSASANLSYTGTAQKKEVYTVTENGADVPAVDGSNGLKFKLSTNDVITITPTFGGITHVDENSDENNSFDYALDNSTQYDAVSTVKGTVKIIPDTVTVTADDKTRHFGSANPTFTASYGGFVPGEDENVLTGVPSYDCTANNTSPIGDYDIRIDLGSLAANHGNYAFKFVDGTLHVTSSPIEVTSRDKTWEYDGTRHYYASFELRQNGTTIATVEPTTADALSSSYKLDNGDTITVNFNAYAFNFSPDATPNRIASVNFTRNGVNVNGDYPDVTTREGELRITPRPITITPNSRTVAGDNAFTYDGSVHRDPGYTVTGTLVSPDVLAVTVRGSVIYPDTTVDNRVTSCQLTTGIQSNYSFVLDTGKLEVKWPEASERTKLTITPTSASKEYDGTPLTSDSYTLAIEGGDTYTVGAEGFHSFANHDKLYVDIQGSNLHVGDVNTNHVDRDPVVMHGTVDVTAAYDITYSATGTLTITKKHASVTSASGTHDYDGNPYKKEVVYPSGFVGSEGSAVVCSNFTEVTDPGTYENKFKITGGISGDYTVDTIYGTLTVNAPEAVTVTITGKSDILDYDGQEHEAHGYTWTSSNPTLFGAADFRYKASAPVTDSIAKGMVAGTYTMALNADDFENLKPAVNVTFLVTPGTLTINKKTTSIVITAASGSKVYDGTELTNTGISYTQGVLLDGDELTATVQGGRTDVGQAPNQVASYQVMRGSVDVTNCYTFGNRIDGVLTVTKRPVTLTSATASKTYDGTALTNNTVTPDGFVGTQGATYTVTGTQTAAGSSANTFTYTLNDGTLVDNYNISTVTGTLTVNKKAVTVKITGNTGSHEYDGTEHSVSGYTVSYEGNDDNLYGTSDFTFNGTASAAGTHAGTYNMGLAATQFVNNNANFDVTFQIVSDGAMTITSVTTNVTVTINGNHNTWVYDGNEHVVEGYTMTATNALFTEDCFTFSGTARAARTDVGTTNMNLAASNFTTTTTAATDFTGTVSFEIDQDGYVTITQNPTAMSVTCPIVSSHEYDGNNFAAPAATCNVAGATIHYSIDNGENWTTTIPTRKDVGTTTVKVKATHDNYADATCSYDLVVTKAPLTVTAASRNFIYCGSAHSIDTVTTPYTVSGLVPADAAATHTATVTGGITFPSENPKASVASGLTLSGADINNYEVGYVDGALTVSYNPTTLTLRTYGHTWTYDGQLHDTLEFAVTLGGTTTDNLTSTFTLPNGHDVLTVNFDNASVINVNEGEVSNTIANYTILNGSTDVSGNYIVNPSIGKLKIDPKPANIKAASGSWVYDGDPHSDNSYEVTGLVSPNTLVATVVGSQTAVGSSENVVTEYHLTNGNLDNYTISTTVGTLEVTEIAPVTLKITSNSHNWEYDGNAHSDIGYTLSINGGIDTVVIGNDYTFANGDVLTVSISGTVTDYTATAVDNEITNVKVMRGTTDISSKYSSSGRTNGKLTISKRPVAVSVTGHTTTDTYDGTEKKAEGYDLACTDALFNTSTVSYSGTAMVTSTNACDLAMSLNKDNFSTSDANFEATFTLAQDGHLTINKRAATITATDEPFTYDGAVHNASAALFTKSNIAPVDENKVSITVSGSIKYPSQSPVTKVIESVVFDPSELANNYIITPVNGKLTMTYGERIALDIYSLGDTVIYDGTSHHKDGIAVAVAGGDPDTVQDVNTFTLANGDKITITLGTPVTDATAGTLNDIASYTILNGTESVRDKYNVQLHPGTLVVNRKEVTVTSATHEWPYDGFEHSDHSFTVEGLVGTDEIAVHVEGTVLTPDTIDNEIVSISMAPGNASNYTFVKVKGKLSVRALTGADRIALTITPNSETKMYDGTDLTADGFTMLFNGNTYSVGANGVYNEFGNHDRLFVDIQGANKHVSTNTTNRNTVASWEVTHNGVNVSSNYNVTLNTGDLIITPRSITMTSASDSKVYDATALTNDGVTVTGDGFITGEGANYNVTGTQTVVGSSDNTFTYGLTTDTQADDYTIATPVYGTLEVTKRPITITANNYSVMYNGELHTYAENPTILTVEAGSTDRGLVSTHVIADTSVEGSRTDVGTTPIVVHSADIHDVDNNNVTDNYDFDFVAGALTITPRTGVIVTIKGHNAEYDYDDQYHLLQGYDVETNYTLYTENDFNFSGTAQVNEKGTPDYKSTFPMGLHRGQFSNTNSNYENVYFDVTDGVLIIYPKLKATVETTPISCNSANTGTNNDGTATVTVTGGKPDQGRYSYKLNENAAAYADADSTFTNLTAGDYTVTITDSLNVSIEVTFTLEEPTELTATIIVPTDASGLCPNQGTYPVSVSADGSNGGYTYAWSGSSTFSSTTDDATNVNQSGPNDCGTTYTVTVTVTDNKGCKKTVDSFFKVQDNEKPTFTVPAALTLYKDASCNASADTTVTHSVPTDLADNCTPASAIRVHYSDEAGTGSCANEEVIIRTWWVTDSCGNSSATATQTITLTDTTRPTFTVPATLTLYKDEHNHYDADTNTTHSVPTNLLDNCSSYADMTIDYTDVVEDNVDCTGHTVITRTWSVTDACGNTSNTADQTIDIIDTVRPTYVRPHDTTLYKDAACVADTTPANIGVPTDLADNSTTSTNLMVTYRNAEFTSSCEGSYSFKRIWRVIDDCGNVSVSDSVQIITVKDTTRPTFTVPAALTLYKTETCEYSADTNVTHSVPTNLADNCSDASDMTIQYTDVTEDNVGCQGKTVITRTWTVKDACGRTSNAAIQIITVLDTTRPTFTVPATLTLYKDEHNHYDADTNTTHSVPTNLLDNCSSYADMTIDYTDVVEDNVDCTGHTVITRTWSVTDACGNTSNTADQTIDIIDTVRPTYVRPHDTTLYKDAACVADTTPANIGVPTDLADNSTTSTNLMVTYRNAEFTSSCEGSYSFKRIWRVIDDCGNVSVSDSVQIITVKDTTRPTFTAPADTTICRVNGEIVAPITVTGDVTDEADNCTTTLNAVWEDLDTLPAANSGNRIISRQWTLTDACGNSTIKTQYITIRPSVLTENNIVFSCPDTTITLNYGVCDTLIELAHTPFAEINQMSGMTIVLDSFHVSPTHRYSADLSPDTIIWRITDECGDYREFKQIVNVKYPPCGGTMMAGPDGDGISYRTVQVGCNCWMAENMRTTKYVDGTAVTPAPMTYGTPVTTYGYLYTYYAATKTTPPTRSTRATVADGQGICPEGWHIPDDADFEDLMAHFDGTEELMSANGNWVTTGTPTNTTGFNLEPAGMYNSALDRYEYLYVESFMWSYTPGSTVYHACEFGSACGTIEIIPSSANNGLSVRCVRNAE